MAADHGDAPGVDPETVRQQGDDGLVGPALLRRCLDLHLERVAEPANDLVPRRSRHDLEAQASHANLPQSGREEKTARVGRLRRLTAILPLGERADLPVVWNEKGTRLSYRPTYGAGGIASESYLACAEVAAAV